MPFYSSFDGSILVDEIVKYESLNEGLEDILQRLGIPFDGSLTIRAKSKYRKDRKPYQKVYTNKQKTIIENAFKDEISLHGYKF